MGCCDPECQRRQIADAKQLGLVQVKVSKNIPKIRKRKVMKPIPPRKYIWDPKEKKLKLNKNY